MPFGLSSVTPRAGPCPVYLIPIRCDAAISGLKEVPGLPIATLSVCNRRGLDGGRFLLAGIRLKAGMTVC